MTDTMAVESFIDFCDNMQIEIANEGFLSSLKNTIKSLINKAWEMLKNIAYKIRNRLFIKKYSSKIVSSEKKVAHINDSKPDANEKYQEVIEEVKETMNDMQDQFKKSQQVAKDVGVDNDKILLDKKDIDDYFKGIPKTVEELDKAMKDPNWVLTF